MGISRTLLTGQANEAHGLVHWSTKPNREERLRGKRANPLALPAFHPAAVCFRRLLRHPDSLARFITSTGRASEQISAAMLAMGNSIYRIINLPIICCSPPPSVRPSIRPSSLRPSVRPDAQSSRKFDSEPRWNRKMEEKRRSFMPL